MAKKKLDDYNFFGGTLHICYAPEFETVHDTREKLQERRRAVATRVRKISKLNVYCYTATTCSKVALTVYYNWN